MSKVTANDRIECSNCKQPWHGLTPCMSTGRPSRQGESRPDLMPDHRDEPITQQYSINSSERCKVHADTLAVALQAAIAPATTLDMYVNGKPLERELRYIIGYIQNRYGVAKRPE